MRTMVTLAALSLALTTAAGVGAQGSISMEEAVALALESNRSLERSRIDLDAAARTVSSAWNDVLPRLSVGASASQGGGQSAIGAQATASLSLSMESLHARESAEPAYEAAALAYETTRRDVELSVRKAFYSLLLKKEKIRLAEQGLETARRSFEQVEARRKAGLATELDALSALVRLESQRPSLEASRIDYESSLDSFRQLLGFEGDGPIELEGSIEPALGTAKAAESIDPEPAAFTAPSVRSLEASLAVAEASLAKARRAVCSPSLSLSAAYKPSLADASLERAGSLSASLSLSLDGLLPWSDARLAVASAEDSVAKLRSQLAEARDKSEAGARALRRSIAQSIRSIEASRLSESLALKTYELTDEAYRFGTKDLLSLQAAQDSLAEARVRTSENAYALSQAVLELEYIMGVPFGSLGRE